MASGRFRDRNIAKSGGQNELVGVDHFGIGHFDRVELIHRFQPARLLKSLVGRVLHNTLELPLFRPD